MRINLDSIIYFSCNAFAEAISFEMVEFEGKKVSYQEIIATISENIELLNQLSTPNLVLVFSELYGDENVEKIKLIDDILINRIKNGDSLFAGSNIEKDSFVGTKYAWDKLFYSKSGLSITTINVIANIIQNDYDEFKKNNADFCENVLTHCATYDSIGNFLYHYKNGNIDEEKMNFLREIVKENPNIIKKFNFGLLQKDIFKLGKSFITHIARYPNLSAKLIIIYENNINLYNHFVESVIKKQEFDSKSEFYEKIEHLLKYYAMNVGSIKQEYINDNLIECALYNQFQVNEYTNNILTPEQFLNRNDIFDRMMNQNLGLKDFAEIFSCRYFSMPYKKLKSFVEIYGQDDYVLENNNDLKIFIENAKRIINISDEVELQKLYSNFNYNLKPSDVIKLESNFRRAYAQTFVDSMEKTYQYILNNSQKEDGISICELKDDFGLPVHSTDSGFKEEKSLINGSFIDTWRQRADSSDHLISTAYTDQDFLGTVSVGNMGVLYGFLKLKAEDINLIGITDINSHVRTSYYAAQNTKYYSASRLTRHARRVYCEIATERIGINPDCIVIYDDMNENVKNNSYNAAREFGIPIVKIDKTYIAKRQLANIDKLIEELIDSNDVEVLCELVSIYETNMAGWLLNRDENNPIVQKGFMKYVNEDGTDANPDRTASIDHSYLANEFLDRGLMINKVINNLIEIAKTNKEMAEVIRDMNKIIELMQKEMQTYVSVNEMNMPITQTRFSFDGETIIKSAQSVLNGINVDQKNLDKPTISILEMVDVFLNGNDCITKKDLLAAEEQMNPDSEKVGGIKSV